MAVGAPKPRLFVTAGNTYAPIDAVRGVTNVFTGRTGADVALAAARRGWRVRLATSHPEWTADSPFGEALATLPYRTFDELQSVMESEIGAARPDAVIHAAAVGDYHVANVYSLAEDAVFDPRTLTFQGEGAALEEGNRAGKIASAHRELWLRLLPAPKLVDRIRSDWRFAGVLVKFKLEVGVDRVELCRRGERARVASGADLLVANAFETVRQSAIVLRADAEPEPLARDRLAERLLDHVENLLAR
jgi:phosphopantothenate-cysteine ligase/phosphopantothenoylcysteine decarboxylase/phosphopantothenate--cysteine ligase